MDLELSLVQYSGNARLFSCANSPLFLPFFYSRCTRAVLCWVPPFWILCAGSWTAQEGCCCTMLGCSDLRETRINSTAISSDALFYRTSIHLPTLNKKNKTISCSLQGWGCLYRCAGAVLHFWPKCWFKKDGQVTVLWSNAFDALWGGIGHDQCH